MKLRSMVVKGMINTEEGAFKRKAYFRYPFRCDPGVSADNAGEVTVHFFTGDVMGNFVVKVFGRSVKGEISN